MSGRKWYEWLLTITYLAMVVVCIYLNLFTDKAQGLGNIIVNVVMFVVVAIVFLGCDRNAFFPTNRMNADLRRVTLRIRQDAQNSSNFLWEQYRATGESLFTDPFLQERYSDFLREMERIANSGKAYIRCSTEDFINEDLTDDVMHRNILNQVPGALTGLGILGTFVGLSMGLHGFATGSTAEITNSIAPLMGGIKVAFHTSIYGMVFSLVFNYVLKRKLEETEAAIRAFLNAYRNYVLPDAETDGMNLMIDLERQQLDSMKSLADTIAASLAQGMAELLEPQFDRFDDTISHFAEGAEKNQMDALGVIVSAFIAEMNKSLGHSFSQLSYTIDQAYRLQEGNATQLKLLLEGTAQQAERYTTWLDEQEKLLRELHEDVVKLPASTEQAARIMSESLLKSDAEFKEMVNQVETMTRQVPYTFSDAYDGVRDTLEDVHNAIERLNDSLVETIKRMEQMRRSNNDTAGRPSVFGGKK